MYQSLLKHLKIVHPDATNLPAIKFTIAPVDRRVSKEIECRVGGPLLYENNGDSSDNANMLLSSNFAIDSPQQTNLMEEDNLNVDTLLASNVKELDHFNFEIGEAEERFVCDVCLKEFPKLKALILHLNLHTAKYTCHVCFKVNEKYSFIKNSIFSLIIFLFF